MIPDKKFEYLIVVQLFRNYRLKRVFGLSWNQFFKFKRWHSTMRAWNISVTEKLLKEAKIIIDYAEIR